MRHHPGLAASPRVRGILIVGRVAYSLSSACPLRRYKPFAADRRGLQVARKISCRPTMQLLNESSSTLQPGGTVPTNRVGPKSRVRNCMGLGSADPQDLSTTMRCRVLRMKARGERNTTPDSSARTDVSRLAPKELTFEKDLEGRTRRTAVPSDFVSQFANGIRPGLQRPAAANT